jgi:UDP-N-acetylmuramoyl-tripeptide--D-alanyl-D-alanine ligase
LPKNGRIYLNKDIDSLPDLTSNLNYPICYFSINSKADIYVKDTKTLSDGITVKIVYKDKALPVKIDLLSIRQVSNLLPAVAIAYDLGMTTEEIGGQLLQIKPTDNRLSLKKGINGSLIIDDSYNSNIEGFKTAIETARQYTQPVKIIVTKGIIELGQEKSESYEQIVDKIYKAGVKLYTTDRLFKKMDKNNQVLLFKKEKDLGDYLCSMLDQHTLLIIEGKFTQQFIKSIIKL